MQLRINFRNCHSTKKPYNWFEPKVKPLVDAMNTVYGVKTMASCQGHFSLSKNKPPYVYFKAPTVVAAQAEYLIRFEQIIGGTLNYNWEIIGRFDENYEMTFQLYSPELHDGHYSLLTVCRHFLFCRHRLDSDIRYLTDLFKQLSSNSTH